MKRKKVFSAPSLAAYVVLPPIAVMIFPCILGIGLNPDNIAECIIWPGIACLACILLAGLRYRRAFAVVSMDSNGISNGRRRIRWEDIGQVTTAEENGPLGVRFTFICIRRDALPPIEHKTLKDKSILSCRSIFNNERFKIIQLRLLFIHKNAFEREYIPNPDIQAFADASIDPHVGIPLFHYDDSRQSVFLDSRISVFRTVCRLFAR